jgi:D-psicose/D-tagatose/L-ribulose 3-epimerase
MGFKYTVVCDTFGFLGYDVLANPREILQLVRNAGYDGADLPGNPKRMDPKRLRPIVESIGLDVPELLGAWAYFHGGEDRDLAGGDEEARSRGIKYAKETIDLAAEMGARFFEICAAQPPVPELPFPRLPVKTLCHNFLMAVREICAYATDREIAILFEPLNPYEAYPGVLSSVYDAISLCEALQPYDVGIQPDLSHMNVSDPAIPDVLRAAGKYVRHVHINESPRYRLGSGHHDWREIMRALKDIGFEGYLAIYMPYTTEEAFRAGSGGYGQPEGVADQDEGGKLDLGAYLEEAISFLKDMERSLA